MTKHRVAQRSPLIGIHWDLESCEIMLFGEPRGRRNSRTISSRGNSHKVALDWAAFALVPSIIQLSPKWCQQYPVLAVCHVCMADLQEFAGTGISWTLPGDLLGQSHPEHSQQLTGIDQSRDLLTRVAQFRLCCSQLKAVPPVCLLILPQIWHSSDYIANCSLLLFRPNHASGRPEISAGPH